MYESDCTIHDIISAFDSQANHISKLTIDLLYDIRRFLEANNIDVNEESDTIYGEIAKLLKTSSIFIFSYCDGDDGVYLFGDDFDRETLFNRIDSGEKIKIYICKKGE